MVVERHDVVEEQYKVRYRHEFKESFMLWEMHQLWYFEFISEIIV